MKNLISLIILLSLKNIFFVKSERDGRLSLFNIVTFKNGDCDSSDSTAKTGICFTSTECRDQGGKAAGKCAAGFGVCCIITVSNCGGTTTKNNTYIRNPGFPTAYSVNAATNCDFTIERSNNNICSIRLDFVNLVTSEPADGACGMNNFDKITITSPSGFSPPGPGGICGDGLSGQHMYIDTANTGSVRFSFAAGTAAVMNRRWNIRTTQFECNDVNRPPPGCTQYFTGTTGAIKSYNFDGGQIIDGQIYSNCIRQEEGYCSINYFAVGDNDFKLKAGTLTKSQDAAIAIDCQHTSVVIPSVVVAGVPAVILEFCGGKFNTQSLQTAHGVATSDNAPFRFDFRSKTNSDNSGLAGFNLMYSQVAC